MFGIIFLVHPNTRCMSKISTQKRGYPVRAWPLPGTLRSAKPRALSHWRTHASTRPWPHFRRADPMVTIHRPKGTRSSTPRFLLSSPSFQMDGAVYTFFVVYVFSTGVTHRRKINTSSFHLGCSHEGFSQDGVQCFTLPRQRLNVVYTPHYYRIIPIRYTGCPAHGRNTHV